MTPQKGERKADTDMPQTGADLIAAERQRQVDVEGWTPEHDDGHPGEGLALAAACYATPAPLREFDSVWTRNGWVNQMAPRRWPWDWTFWKPAPEDRVRELVKAGALIAAEIDRLTRAQDA